MCIVLRCFIASMIVDLTHVPEGNALLSFGVHSAGDGRQ